MTPPEVSTEVAPEIDLTDLARWRDGFSHEALIEIRFYEELIRRFAGFEPAGPHASTRDDRLFSLKSLPVRGIPR